MSLKKENKMIQDIVYGDFIEKMIRFSEQAEKISSFEEIDKKIGFSINFNIENGMKYNSNLLDDNKLKSLLMDMRFFIMKNSSFEISKILKEFIKINFMINEVRNIEKIFLHIMNNEEISLKYNNSKKNNRWIFNTILNEDNFHQEKKQKGMSIIKSHPAFESMSRLKFQSTIFDLRRIVMCLNNKVVLNYINKYENKK